ncbi:properdin-like, partial [Watersipora subatra]|uniref:properdin-like n=1 Tax=Watersipora subatra TaxID=2589382 RepID=UPI00355C39B9
MAKFSAGVSVTRLRLGVSWRLYVVYVTWSTCLYLVAAQNPKCEDLPGCLAIQGRGTCGRLWENICVTFIGCDTLDSSVVMCGLGSQQTTATGFEFCLPGVPVGARIPVEVNADNTEGPQNLGIEISGLDVTCERFDDVCDGNPGFELTFIAPPCPCICTEWSNWGACPTECGVTGTQQRTRSCDNTCDTESEENDCLVISCPTCSCTSWTNWRSCPRTCGVAASRRRTRVCSNNCDTQSDRKSCPFRNCDPTPAVWNGWSAWTPCQVSCGGSTQTRTRTCSNIRDIFDCPGSFTESQTCGEEPCPNCDCTIWSTWTTCSISCGTSQNRQRSRSCIDCFSTSTPVTDTSSCPGIPTVCLTAGVWAEWSQWTP